MRWLWGVVLSGVCLGVAGAQGVPVAPASAPVSAPASAAVPAPASAPATLGPVPVDADWSARAEAWFKGATDEATRKEAMREITKAMKQPCRHCHTPDFTGYTDFAPISRQMMALSAEHGVTCAECHKGKSDLTDLGHKAQRWWVVSHQEKVFCDHCHVPAKHFLELTPAGRAWQANEAKKKAP